MPVEPGSIFEGQGIRDKIAGKKGLGFTKYIFGGTARRNIASRYGDLGWYAATWAEKRAKAEPGTKEKVLERAYTRFRWYRFIGDLTKFGLPVGFFMLGGVRTDMGKATEVFLEPERITLNNTLNGREVSRLSLLDGEQGLGHFCNDIANASKGIDKKTYDKVDFNNPGDTSKPGAWGDGYSELRYQVEGFSNFWEAIRTSGGRERLKQDITIHANGNQGYIDTRSSSLGKLKTHLEEKGLSSETLSDVNIKEYFTSVGYTEENWQILTDVIKVWKTKQAVPGLQERINSCTKLQKVSIEQENEARMETANILLQTTEIDQYIDAETVVGLAGVFPNTFSPEEIQATVGQVWYPEGNMPKTSYGVSSLMITPIIVALMINNSPKLWSWGLAKLEELGRKFPQADLFANIFQKKK